MLAPAARALALLSLLVGASAWMGSTLPVAGPGSADRSPVLVFTPNVRTSAKLPVVLLLHSRCQNALGADAYFHFANLVDQARASAVLLCCSACHAPEQPCCCVRCTFLFACCSRGAQADGGSRGASSARTVWLRARGSRGDSQPERVRRVPVRPAGRQHVPPVGCHARVLRGAPGRRRRQLDRGGRLGVHHERTGAGEDQVRGGRAARVHRRPRGWVRANATKAHRITLRPFFVLAASP
jgi:hypothetical protein